MAPRKPASDAPPIGEALEARRADVLKKGLREMAKLLNIAPAHLTDIEKGRRSPSDALLMRIARQYQMDEADLRAAWATPSSLRQAGQVRLHASGSTGRRRGRWSIQAHGCVSTPEPGW